MANYGIYKKLGQIYNRGVEKIVVDAGFKITGKEHHRDFHIKSSQQDPIRDANSVLVYRDATLVRQLSERGMKMIHGP